MTRQTMSACRLAVLTLLSIWGLAASAAVAPVVWVLQPVDSTAVLGHKVVIGYQSQDFAETMDPHGRFEIFTLGMLGAVYEPLLRFDADMKLQPGLATTWTQVEPLRWRFTLRPGVKFQDGADLTADFDLADLAVDELTEMVGLDDAQARDLIMKAREHWFTA